jgi:eukaryotic-like serine/threonine-protein kinase
MLERLIHEIHRRSMWQVLAIFVASGWAVLQVIDALIGNGLVPAWVFTAGVVLLLLGLPIVLATAFVQEGLPGPSPEKGANGEAPVRDVVAESPPANLAAGTGSLDRVSTRAPTHHRLFTWRNAVLGGVGAFALLGVGAGGWMAMRVLGIGPVGTLAAQGVIDRGAEVVLADFESRDDPELGNVVTRTLAVDLSQSPMLRVVERTELNEPLMRMQLDPDTAITSLIATQLAEREGYAAVIAGTLARVGSGYVLTAAIHAGEGFRRVAAFRETARGDDDLVDAIERLSRAIRAKAGESLRTVQRGESLAQVTTSSLPALRAFTRGDVIYATGDWAGALGHFERAVAIDSTFATAYRGIAGALFNLGVRRADAIDALRHAVELRDRLPPLESQLAIGSYHINVSGDGEAAAHAFEQALAIDSMNITARNNLGLVYSYTGRHADAARHYATVLRIRPRAAAWNNLALIRFNTGDLAGAMATADSGMAQLPTWKNGYFLKALFAGASQDFGASDSITGVLERNAGTAWERVNARRVRFAHSLVRGRLRDAERALDGPAELVFADPIYSAAMRATIRLLRGDTAAAVQLVERTLAEADSMADSEAFHAAILVLSGAGAAGPAAAALSSWAAAVPEDQLGLIGGQVWELAAADVRRMQGDFATALASLRALHHRCPGCSWTALPFSIARTHDDRGVADEAIAAYEESLALHDEGLILNDPLQLPHTLRRLGELYDAQGNTAKAVEYYARFVNLWRDADPELQPLVRRAQERLNALRPDRG